MSPRVPPAAAIRSARLTTGANRSRGFTLVELMVTVAIGVVLMVVAAPSFVQFRKNADLSDAVSSFIMASGAAKSAALKTGKNAYVQVNNTTLGWRSGWFVFLDNNWNGSYEAASDEIVLRREALASDIVTQTPGTTTLASGYLLFNGSGFTATKTGVVDGNKILIMEAPAARSSSIFVDATGRVRSCRTGETGCSF